MTTRREAHWDDVHRTRDPSAASWYERVPARSLAWVIDAAPDRRSAVIDVGAGTSLLVDGLLEAGYRDVTVLDVAPSALAEVRRRLGSAAAQVRFVAADVLRFRPDRTYDVWHDRAVFHFLVDEEDRARYRDSLRAALRAGGHAIVATFAPGGPERCSGLPTMRYDAAGLVAALGEGLSLVRHEEAIHVTPGGAAQPFTWVCVLRS